MSETGMIDKFALLQLPRRPWLDEQLLKEQFFRLSAVLHPDRLRHEEERRAPAETTKHYADLTSAYATLKEAKDRLRHLLELETGESSKDVKTISGQSMSAYLTLANLCRDVDAFIRHRSGLGSAMLKAQTLPRSLEWMDKLQQALKALNLERDALVLQAKELNLAWEAAPDPGHPQRLEHLPLKELDALYRSFGYVTRWQAQLHERLLGLSI